MISDEPDEDADGLDDDAMLEAHLTEAWPAGDDGAKGDVIELPDWPARRTQETVLSIDSETLAWFRKRHANWRREMAEVLRGWVAANDALADSDGVPAPDTDAGRREQPA